MDKINDFLGQKGGIGEKINNATGGGEAGERKEDYLDKGIDYVQERLGQGDQNNETSANQAQDELIAGQIRSQFKERTGQDFPIKDGMGAQEK